MRYVLGALVGALLCACVVDILQADEKDAAIRKTLNELDGTPIGVVNAFAGPRSQVKPGGWLYERGWRLCDGASVPRADYEELFAVIGAAHGGNSEQTVFHLPDLRGRFVRGVDHGAAREEGAKGRDVDASARISAQTGGNATDLVGSLQLDQFQGHKHKDLGHYHNYMFFQAPYRSGDDAHDRNCEDVAGTGKTSLGYARITDPVESKWGKPRFGLETRPSNIALNWIIKAKPRTP